ncbi:MAG: hypothetical protein OEY85_00635 [Rhodospirillales bacterium]|nr:hypothetical protein [Rhodospirillales bacterium]
MRIGTTIRRAVASFIVLAGLGGTSLAEGKDFLWNMSGSVEAQMRYFPQEGPFPDQHRRTAALAVDLEFDAEWDDGSQTLSVEPFVRLDEHDSRRSHWDMREFVWRYTDNKWNVRVGLDKVFWGVSESRHLIDIVNQTDLIESPDEESKLGQPMIGLSYNTDWGDLDLFYLPYFRERTFPGGAGRLRNTAPVDTDEESFDSGLENFHPDVAARWSKTFNAFDVGLSYFYGTSREPRIVTRVKGNGAVVPAPHYDLISQTALDVQATYGDWLWKLEAMTRSGHGDRFAAVAGGFEYTHVGFLDSRVDLGILAEYLYDGRDKTAPATLYDNDLFIGLRFVLNDEQSTEVLAGVIKDLNDNGHLFFIEASRRFGDNWKGSFEFRSVDALPSNDPFQPLRRDDYLQVGLAYFF